jgi:hypothetical protein
VVSGGERGCHDPSTERPDTHKPSVGKSRAASVGMTIKQEKGDEEAGPAGRGRAKARPYNGVVNVAFRGRNLMGQMNLLMRRAPV